MSTPAFKEGLAVEKLVLVQAWREAGSLFDTRERSALAWAETVTRVADTAVPDADFQAASAVFSEKELTRESVGLKRPPGAKLPKATDITDAMLTACRQSLAARFDGKTML